ncbi:hypothetical protein ACQR1N_31085 [Bradyrhizobium sp. HKCCYLRH1073]|uniref:hypothetical protein n=1 Tax=unclassified Bradyrhizobium TaxID=2631580 RepID=UPI003EB9A412
MLVSDQIELIKDAIAASVLPGDRDPAAIKELFAAYAVVYGVYPDEEEHLGYRLQIIKGERTLQLLAQGESRSLDRRKVTSLLCRDAEEVIALSKVYGDALPLM